MRSLRHTVAAAALVAGIAYGVAGYAQMGSGTGTPGSGAGAQANPSSPSDGTSPMPGGAPGVQREPLNVAPGATTDDGRARAPTGMPGDAQNRGGGGEQGGVGTTMSDDEIHQACMMKASPEECRSRMRNGETDPSVERNPP